MTRRRASAGYAITARTYTAFAPAEEARSAHDACASSRLPRGPPRWYFAAAPSGRLGFKSTGRRFMTRLRFAAALGLTFGLLATVPVQAWTRGQVDVLAVLPAASGSVEGITVGPDGNVYAPTFGFNTTGALGGNAKMFVISPSGNIVRTVTIANSSPHVLG